MQGCRQQLLAHNSQWLRRALERAAKIIWLLAQAVSCTGRWIEAYLGPPKALWRGVWCPSPIGSGCCILVRSASGVKTLIGGCSWKKPTHFILMTWRGQTKKNTACDTSRQETIHMSVSTLVMKRIFNSSVELIWNWCFIDVYPRYLCHYFWFHTFWNVINSIEGSWLYIHVCTNDFHHFFVLLACWSHNVLVLKPNLCVCVCLQGH